MRNPRTFTYRIPLDDSKAFRKINVLDSLNTDYQIYKLPKSKVPNGKAVKNWHVAFYQSKETTDHKSRELVGGTIPGLAKYRYSLDWERTPDTELIEMKHNSGGGTKLRGEKFHGTGDPQLSDYVKIDTAVPWTPGEIKAMFDGEEVPDRMNYSHDPRMIEAKEARRMYHEVIETAARDGAEKAREALQDYRDNCDHKVVTTDGAMFCGYCEDCGRGFEQHGLDELDDGQIVGAV